MEILEFQKLVLEGSKRKEYEGLVKNLGETRDGRKLGKDKRMKETQGRRGNDWILDGTDRVTVTNGRSGRRNGL